MDSTDIRDAFFSFFEKRGHVRLPSAPLVLKDDPSVLFTSAGMQPLVPYFTGRKQPPAKRIVTVQKVLRTSDIDEVGRDAYHQTFWEMLGNFSIGDYWKSESLQWSWELLTGPFGFDGDRLVATVHTSDDEAYDIWTKQIRLPPHRVFRLGDESNFWTPGPTGLCGPDSEIFIDKGPQPGVRPHECDPSENCGRYVEIWNNVFQQYDRQADGRLVPLAKKNIDTGAGLERIAQVLQGVPGDTFRTDLFAPIVEKVEQLAGVRYGDGQADLSIRIVAEHSRAATFLIGDGIEPSNENRGYVLRRLIRRAALHARRLGLEPGSISQLGLVTVRLMQAHYHELAAQRERIAATLENEERKFEQTLSSGLDQLNAAMAAARAAGRGGIDGDTAFRLYDTFGFPIEMTREIAGSAGLDVDEGRYRELLEQQRARSRASAKFSQDAMRFGQFYEQLRDREGVRSAFTGYGELSTDAKILSLASAGKAIAEAREGTEVEIVLDRTPFYAEGGGQVGDRGHITTSEGRAIVADTQSPAPEVTVMIGTVVDGVLQVGAPAHGEVDAELRRSTMRNHTGTHLLHAALRRVLGEEVHQAGSLVHAPDLRFDFTFGRAPTPEELRRVEDEVNAAILANAEVHAHVMPLQDALASGAQHLFDEKYGSEVRVVEAGPTSRELCGGTHCHATGDIGLLLITQEGSVGAGIRRIEAVTGEGALATVRALRERTERAARVLRVPTERLPDAVEQLALQRERLEKELEATRRAGMDTSATGLVAKAETLDGTRLVVVNVGEADAEHLRALSDKVRDQLGSGVVVLGGVRGERAALAVGVTKDLLPGVSADAIVKQVAPIIGGSGGGRPQSATGGGREIGRLGEALDAARGIVRDHFDGGRGSS
ncbi:MAG: alanine--tRNA ligase [Chloroflexota bacterium]|nr:alanine--tRNA ligase [Chloroflexota bacterium]